MTAVNTIRIRDGRSLPRGRTSSTMPTRIPSDVIRNILDGLLVWPDETLIHYHGMLGRRNWLAHAMTTSHAWYTAGLPLLYKTIEIKPKDELTLNLLLRTFKRRPELCALVRNLRPYERDYNGRGRRARKGDFFNFVQPNIPFVTERGRAQWALERRTRKWNAVMNMCRNVGALLIDAEDLQHFAPGLSHSVHRLQRVAFENADRLDLTQFSQVCDWSALRSLRLDASGHFWKHNGSGHESMPRLEAAQFSQMSRLEELEILGWVTPSIMRDILLVVRSSLRTLTCHQYYGAFTTEEWLAPVASTLVKLSLLVHCDTPMSDLSSLTALKVLRLVMIGGHSNPTAQVPNPQTSFPPVVETVEWDILEMIMAPHQALRRIHDLMDAFDFGAVPNLKAVFVRAPTRYPQDEDRWTGGRLPQDLPDEFSSWLSEVGSANGNYVQRIEDCVRQRRVNCRFVFVTDFNCVLPKDPRDVFAESSWTFHDRKEREQRGRITRMQTEAGAARRAWWKVKAKLSEIAALCCCFAYMGCALCRCNQFFD